MPQFIVAEQGRATFVVNAPEPGPRVPLLPSTETFATAMARMAREARAYLLWHPPGASRCRAQWDPLVLQRQVCMLGATIRCGLRDCEGCVRWLGGGAPTRSTAALRCAHRLAVVRRVRAELRKKRAEW